MVYPMNEKYSVLMPLYIRDDPNWFIISIESILNQTLPPDEIFIICDGHIPQKIEESLSYYIVKYPHL